MESKFVENNPPSIKEPVSLYIVLWCIDLSVHTPQRQKEVTILEDVQPHELPVLGDAIVKRSWRAHRPSSNGCQQSVSAMQTLGVRLSFCVSHESKLILSPLPARDPLSSRTSIWEP
jgi:hypothetical protein